MKGILLTGIVFGAALSYSFDSATIKSEAVSQTKNADTTQTGIGELIFSLDSNSFNFGEVANYERISVVFYAKNVSGYPVVISRATTCCGCDYPTVPRKPIMPGEVVSLSYTYDAHRLGPSIKTMLVTANGLDYIFKFSCRVFEHYRHDERCYNHIPGYVAEKRFGNSDISEFVGLNWYKHLPNSY
ncbi:MAG: DUF1573 domain-containing protein [Chitinophagales bacterium]|nr:DUF1573 domain-containing protein [Chitinophagales bacterium]